jgi:hypothetical protein
LTPGSSDEKPRASSWIRANCQPIGQSKVIASWQFLRLALSGMPGPASATKLSKSSVKAL